MATSADRGDGTEMAGPNAEVIAAREAMRISERQAVQGRPVQRQSATGSSFFIGAIAILIAILSVIAVWLRS